MSVMTVTDHRIPKDVTDQLAAPAAYADGRIHQAYAWLRKNEPLGVADIEVAPTRLDFGEVLGTVTRTVTVTNRGDIAVPVKVTAPGNPFSVGAKLLQILPNSSVILEVTCTNGGRGNYAGAVAK